MISFAKKVVRKMLDAPGNLSRRMKYSRLEKNEGYCVICESDTTFVIHGTWLRDNYRCERCDSIPRNRALINAMNKFAPDWRNQSVHESSPGSESSKLLRKKCKDYSTSHYMPDVPFGTYKGVHRSEDLTAMTFPDNSFDIIVTADVFEHIFEPGKAFAEINRVLKPGGMHIFTIPWIPAYRKSVPRARMNPDKTIDYLAEAKYHRNPVDPKGSLVTYDWGLDLPDHIMKYGKMATTIYLERDRAKGLDGEMLEVFISRKPDAE